VTVMARYAGTLHSDITARVMIGCPYRRYTPVRTPNNPIGPKCLKFNFRHNVTSAPEAAQMTSRQESIASRQRPDGSGQYGGSETSLDMVVDHAGVLHEGIDAGGAHEAITLSLKLPGKVLSLCGR
jgi:hypothetical protein